jgi:hypothetical protein
MKQDNKIVLYTTDSGNVTVSVRFEEETFWMTQKAIAELFDVNVPAISKHFKNIYDEEELSAESTISKMETVQIEGAREVTRTVEFYNLDAVIAVGYRVNSKKATRFRQWATKTLHEYIQKGFVLNDDMLKNGKPFGKDYFDELLERIREIRASERRAYQKIADIFEQCSFDYDKNSDLTREFYSFVQNKLHFAITGKTAAELIAERVTIEHDAAKAVCDVFTGQPFFTPTYLIDQGIDLAGGYLFEPVDFGNQRIAPELNDGLILESVNKIQRRNQIELR